MMADAVRLALSEELRASLIRLLRAALSMESGSTVVDHVPANPWGDLAEFRSAIYEPLHGEASASSPPHEHAVLLLDSHEVGPIRDVLDGISEAYAGGNPWVVLDDRERQAATSVLARLSSEESR